MNISIIQTTCGNKEEAKNIARILISKKLAACVQVKKIKSYYVWNNEFCEDKEWLLTIKTKKNKFEKIEREIKDNHSYDVPEILEIEVKNTSKDYIKFIGESVDE